MGERKRWKMVLLLAGAAVGMAGFSSAAVGNEPAVDEVLLKIGGLSSEADEGPTGLGLIATDQGPALGYRMSEGMSFAFGYDFVTEESLQLEVAESGGLRQDYAGHEVMVRAHWSF